mmetsp:Transcript_28696/g.40331  ORF Transcript_28696/g.40331 Transcript_28696/m.40331 type:complete len:219 (+) Transcript_28696:1049-1705(+)
MRCEIIPVSPPCLYSFLYNSSRNQSLVLDLLLSKYFALTSLWIFLICSMTSSLGLVVTMARIPSVLMSDLFRDVRRSRVCSKYPTWSISSLTLGWTIELIEPRTQFTKSFWSGESLSRENSFNRLAGFVNPERKLLSCELVLAFSLNSWLRPSRSKDFSNSCLRRSRNSRNIMRYVSLVDVKSWPSVWVSWSTSSLRMSMISFTAFEAGPRCSLNALM